MAKAQDGALIGQAGELLKLGEFPIQGRVEEGFFHGRIAQCEPQLQEVDAQHGFQREGWATGAALGVIRGNEFDQRSPGNDPVHLLKEDLLAGLSGRQLQAEQCLFHDFNDAVNGLRQPYGRGSYADHP